MDLYNRVYEDRSGCECVAKRAILDSDHPELEAPCYLIYVLMSEEEMIIDSFRAKIHATEHLIKYLKEISNA